MTKKVLIVDDSAVVRNEIRATLTEAGFVVVEAINGADGLLKLAEHLDLSLVICDVNMPVMDGVEMVEKAKQQSPSSSVPIVMLTTEGQPSLIRRARNAGVKGWIVKPFQPRLFVESVQRLTGA